MKPPGSSSKGPQRREDQEPGSEEGVAEERTRITADTPTMLITKIRHKKDWPAIETSVCV